MIHDLKNQKLLVIAPHPDDEVIGCGGLIQKIKGAGGQVYVLFLTNGDTNDFSKNGHSSREEREEEIKKVAEFLAFDNYDIYFQGNHFHLKLDTIGQMEIMDAIERQSAVSLERIKPTIVAYPSPSSYNQDHKAAALAAHAALRPAPKQNKHNVTTVLTYEEAVDVWSLASLTPSNFFAALTPEQIEKKLSALKLYKSQDRPFPNMRSIKTLKALSVLRGSEIGEEFAEGFQLIKHEV